MAGKSDRIDGGERRDCWRARAPAFLLVAALALQSAPGVAVAGQPPPTAAPSAAPSAAQPAAPVAAVGRRYVFKVFYGNLSNRVPVARLEYTLKQDGASYEIASRAQADGLAALVYSGVMTQTSSGRFGPDGLEPLRYVEQRGKRPQRTISFDHQQKLVTVADGSSKIEFPAGTQDRLSVLYQLGLLVRGSPDKFVAGSTHVLPVASLSRVSHEQFHVIGRETLSTSQRPLRALHLTRPTPPGTDYPKIDVWLGYDFDMLPVRLRMQDPGGRVLDQWLDQDS
jgi:hypothetical protein